MVWNPMKKCKEESCQKTYTDNAIGRAAAYREGWFFPRKDGALCSEHVPDWVKGWRKHLKTVKLDG